jgi:aryl-alcohol dehydrogenase-like predicted oxidoreductase
MERTEFESDSVPVLSATGLSALPYFSLAMGFLSGKYQPNVEVVSTRAEGVAQYRNERGWNVLSTLEAIANELSTSVSAVSLAWLRAQTTVSTPIASARTIDQLTEIMPIVSLNSEQLARLTSASA